MDDRFQGLQDAELVVLAREGQVDAFNCLAGRWEPSIFRFARRMLGDTPRKLGMCRRKLWSRRT